MKKINLKMMVPLGVFVLGAAFCNNVEAVNTYYIKSNQYKFVSLANDKIMTNLNPKSMQLENILKNVSLQDNTYRLKVTDKNSKVVTENKKIMGTGTKITAVKEYNGREYSYENVTLVLYGDTDGDGKITSGDALAIIKNRTGKKKFNNKFLEEAGRVTDSSRKNESTPSATDALAIIKNKTGKINLSQFYFTPVKVNSYSELYRELGQTNTNLKFDTSSAEGKQLQADYLKLKKVVDTYIKKEMNDATKALVLHDYLLTSTALDTSANGNNWYFADKNASNITNIGKEQNMQGYINTYNCLLGIAGIKSEVENMYYVKATIDGQLYYISPIFNKDYTEDFGNGKIIRYCFLEDKESVGFNSTFKFDENATSKKYIAATFPEYRKELNYKNSEIKLTTGKTIVRTYEEIEKAIKDKKSYIVDPVNEQTHKLQEQDERCRKIIAKYIKPEMTIEEKLLTIHDYICSNFIRNDHAAVMERKNLEGEYDCENGRYKSVVLSNMGNCVSATNYFNTLCMYIGVETIGVGEGTIPNPYGAGSHFWSLVKVNGQWYHCDCEGGDYYAYGEVSRTWFLNSDKAMHITENTYKPCTSTKYDNYNWPEFKGVEYYQDLERNYRGKCACNITLDKNN